MRQIPNLYSCGYSIFHNENGKQWGQATNTTSKAKTRFTKEMQYEPYAKRDGVDHNTKFDKQPHWGLYQMINPVSLSKFLEQDATLFGNVGELVEYLKGEIARGKLS